MPWARFDDGVATHPKFVDRTDLAKLVYILSIVYCAREMTDGKMTITDRMIIFAQAGEAATDDRSRITAELVGARLWDVEDGQYSVHDFLDYNRTRQQIHEERKRKSEAGQAGGARSVESRKEKYGTARPEAGASVSASGSSGTPVPTPTPTPTPRPVPDPPANAGEPRASRRVASRFDPPSLEEVRNFMDTLTPPAGWCAEDFHDHFEANGWLIAGKTPMKSWQAAARRWVRKQPEFDADRLAMKGGRQPLSRMPIGKTFAEMAAAELESIERLGI